MKRGLLVLGGIALVAVFALLVALNPGEVEFHPTHLHSFRPMLGVLLILTFCAGGALVLLGGGMRQSSARLSGWRARRSARAATQAAAWHHERRAARGWAGELERSRSLMRKAWRRHAGNSAAALALASSYMDTGEYVAAQEVLQAAARRRTPTTPISATRWAKRCGAAARPSRRSACWRRCASAFRTRRAS